ncbi:unnamed protein product, partial [marine sediment metagenome]
NWVGDKFWFSLDHLKKPHNTENAFNVADNRLFIGLAQVSGFCCDGRL